VAAESVDINLRAAAIQHITRRWFLGPEFLATDVDRHRPIHSAQQQREQALGFERICGG
jgi:hypothetical protein